MNNVKKDIYWHLANHCKIYLPAYQLDLLAEQVTKKVSIWTILTQAETNKELRKYNIKSKGAYVDGNNRVEFLDKTRKKVCRLDAETLQLLETYPSLYNASKEFKKGFGNISRAIKQDSTAYGFRWCYAEQ